MTLPARPLSALALWAPPILWMALIFAGSSVPSKDIPGFFDFPHADKLLHLVEYSALGFLLARALGRRRSISASVLVTLCASLALAHGITDEIHQIAVPGREFSLADLAADTLGGALGSAAWLWALRLRWRPRWL